MKLMLAAKSGHSLFCVLSYVILKYNLHTHPTRDFSFPSFSHIYVAPPTLDFDWLAFLTKTAD